MSRRAGTELAAGTRKKQRASKAATPRRVPSNDVVALAHRLPSRRTLCEFNWTVVPLEDPYLIEFSRSIKPHLTKLLVTGSSHNTSHTNFDEDDSELFDVTVRFEMASVLTMLRACPAFQELQLLFDSWGHTPSQCLQEQLTDGALQAIATTCPRLERIITDEVPGKFAGEPMRDVTDVGLRSLAALPMLSHIALKQLECSVDSVLALVLNAPEPQRSRRVVVKLGWRLNGDEIDTSFFTKVVEYLEAVASLPASRLSGRHFELEFVNDYAWPSHDYRAMHATLGGLRTRITRRHKDVRMLFREQNVVGNRMPRDVQFLDSVIVASPTSAPIRIFSQMFETKWKPRTLASYL